MKVVLLHPTGNRNVRAILQSLTEADMLAEFETTIAVNKASNWLKLLPNGIKQEGLRRSFTTPADKLWTHSSLELARMIFPKIGLKKFTEGENFASIYAVYKNIDNAAAKRLPKIVKKKNLAAVYAYEDGALSIFRQAKKMGLKCIYDLPIAYWETGRKLMMEEAERLPVWANTLGGGIHDSKEKLERKTEELMLADVVVGPGNFVLGSLPIWAKNKTQIISPFGSPINATTLANKSKKNEGPLRVLFAGSMGQRKGLGDLFTAIKLLNTPQIELVVMGSLMESMTFYKGILPNFIFEPGRPNDDVLALMRSCDVFCLPSIVEGRALVMQEAMSQGLPLVITANTGGADLIIEGQTGFLVPIRSPEAIAEKLKWFLDNRVQLKNMSEHAKAHAAKYTWEKYGSTIIQSLNDIIQAEN